MTKRRKPRTFYIGNIDALPENEDWLKMLTRDVGTDGKPIPTRFDIEAEERGEKFTPLLERDDEEPPEEED